MRFIFNKDAMMKRLSVAKEIVSTKNAMSILSNILLSVEDSTLTIICTDTKNSFKTSFGVDVFSEGVTTVYLDKFISILTNLPSGDIEFETDNGKVKIRPLHGKKVKFDLKCLSEDKYPVIEDFNQNDIEYFSVPISELKAMINQTIGSVSDDDVRYFMCGVRFEKDKNNLVLVSTNGKQLSFSTSEQIIPDFQSVTVPTKILSIFVKKCPSEGDVKIAFTDRVIYFQFSDMIVTSVYIDGEFPNYKRVIPENQPNNIVISTEDIIEGVIRVGQLVDSKVKRILLEIKDNCLTLSSYVSDIGEASEEIDCNQDGNDIRLCFDIDSLLFALKTITTENVKIEYSEPSKAITIRPEDSSSLFHVLMPMQII